MYGQANQTSGIGDAAGDALPDPPGCVGGELEALGVIELVGCPEQAEEALLDEVRKVQALALVPLGDGDHETDVGEDEMLVSLAAVFDLQSPGGIVPPLVDGRLRPATGLDAATEGDLLSGGQEVDAGGLAQEPTEAVGQPRCHVVEIVDVVEILSVVQWVQIDAGSSQRCEDLGGRCSVEAMPGDEAMNIVGMQASLTFVVGQRVGHACSRSR